MSDMGTLEASKKWGYRQETIQKWCREGLIKGATHDKSGSPWHIPKDAECPKRIKAINDDQEWV
jgi:hypothetical protein